jgi:hypothetical protein
MKSFLGKYKTKDLSEATTLVVKEIRLLEIAREGNKCWFVFEDSTKRNSISNDYWYGKCLVDAKTYYQANMTLKSQIFM